MTKIFKNPVLRTHEGSLFLYEKVHFFKWGRPLYSKNHERVTSWFSKWCWYIKSEYVKNIQESSFVKKFKIKIKFSQLIVISILIFVFWNLMRVDLLLTLSFSCPYLGMLYLIKTPPKHSRKVWWFFELMVITLEHWKGTGLIKW